MSNVQGPGDLSYNSVTIDGNDVTNFVYQTHIFQDIFTPFWSAQILIADTQNLIMNLPIKPGSKVNITIETTGVENPCSGKKKFSFYVYKISDKQLIKQETQSYIIHCISKEFFENQKARIQKTFKSQTPTTIIKDVISKMGASLGDSDIDPTTYNIIIPNWSPVVTIEWLCRLARKGKAADFLFFQEDDSKYKFKSLNKMFSDSSGLTLKQMLPHVRSNNHNEDEDAFVNIEAYEYIQQHDSAKNFQTGYYANTVIQHDIINKKLITTPFTFGEDIPEDLKKKPFSGDIFEHAELSNQTFAPAHPGLFDGASPLDTLPQWMGSRKTNMMKLEENRLLVTVPGFACGWQWLGKACTVELPSHQDQDKNITLDKYFKGRYLIAAIKHVIGFGRYQMVIELNKKRLEKSYGSN